MPYADAGELSTARPGARVGGRGTFPRPRALPRLVGEQAKNRALSGPRRDALHRRALALADMLAAATALLVGLEALGDDSLRLVILLALPAVVLVGKILGLYEREPYRLHKSTLDEAPRVFQAATLYTLVIWLAEGFLASGQLGHAQVAVLWALVFVAMLAARTLARLYARAWTASERCLVVGDKASAELLRRKLDGNPSLHATVVAQLPFEALNGRPGAIESGGDLEAIRRLLTEEQVERVLVVPGRDDSEALPDSVRLVRFLGAKVSVLPGLLEVVGSSVEFDDLDGMPLLGLRPEALPRSSNVLKRALDLTVATAGLLLLAPLLAAISVAVKLTTPGPVLFRQKRIGREGTEFELLKFRTMTDDAEERKAELQHLNEVHGFFKIKDDPRLTKVGRLLRRMYVDELPQLINVLKGEMSLVGPRPLISDEDRQVEGWQRRRLALRPGMTGPWQLLGPSRVSLKEMPKIDYLYGANWSLWLDVTLLLRTVGSAVGRRGL